VKGSVLRWALALLGALVFVLALGYPTLLGAVGRYLVVNDALEPAGAILVLGGATPYREIEGAAIYNQGWAPKVLLVRPSRNQPDLELMRSLGVEPADTFGLRREVLEKLGVPAEAIVVAPGAADATLDELELAMPLFPPDGSPVILVTSNYHSRRVSLYWRYLVGDSRKAIVRATADRFDPDGWWRQQATILNVVRELLGLANYAVGFPIAQRAQ
jgi:uncharacterized SAM-binding protein YcdF (DUF218 family)